MNSLFQLIFYAAFLTGTASSFQLLWTWSNWQSWSSCSQTCGNAIETRTRECPGAYCGRSEEEQETRACTNECVLNTPCSQVSSGAYDCNFELACPNWSTTFAKGGSTPTKKTGPDYDHTFKHPGCGNFVYLESSNRNSGQITSSKMTTTSESCLMFYANFHSEDPYDMGTLDVSVRPNEGENVLLWERDGSYFSRYKEWLPVNINIPAGTDFQIIFVGTKEHGYRSDLAIDDIQFTPNTRCMKPVDGNWSPWTSYGECSTTCGCGTKLRKRYCDSPARTDDGADCIGMSEEIIPCEEELPACPVKGNWADWGPWSKCTQDCGIEYQTRTQECSDPIPVGEDEKNKCMAVNDDGEMDYALSRMQSRLCNHMECGLDTWSSWTSWSLCSSSCKENQGTKVKTRTCPDARRVRCVPDDVDNVFENDEIVVEECSGDAICGYHWTAWTDWSDCSITCAEDSGVRVRKQTCPDEDSVRCTPGASYDIKDNTQIETEPCNGPTTCGYAWTEWTDWSNCSVACQEKSGVRVRKQTCPDETNVSCIPDGNFYITENTQIETEDCNGTESCGYQWASWSEWTSCSEACIDVTGVQFRTRDCQDGTDVDDCLEGASSNYETVGNTEIDSANCTGETPCSYTWGDWLDWSECSITCSDDELDTGARYQSRTKYLVEPLDNGDDIQKVNTSMTPLETEFESEICNSTTLCNRGWTDWQAWSDCSGACDQKCGGRIGTQTRFRYCERNANDCTPNDVHNYIGQNELETKSCYGDDECVYTSGGETIEKSKDIGIMDKMTSTWSVSIDIKLLSDVISTSWGNIMRVGRSGSLADAGDRLASMYIRKDTLRLHVTTYINGGNSIKLFRDLTVNEWINVEQRQDYHPDENTYYYKVFMDCNLVLMLENTQPEEFDNMILWTSDNRTNAANVQIRNFVVDGNTTETKHLLQRNYQLLTLPTLAKEWVLRFEVKPYAIRTASAGSVILATSTDETNSTNPGFRIPGMFFRKDTLKPSFFSYVSGDANKNFFHNTDLVLYEWTEIEIKQQSNGTMDSYVYSISVDGSEVHSEEQTTAEEFTDVKLLASNWRHHPAYAAIRNVQFENLVEPDTTL